MKYSYMYVYTRMIFAAVLSPAIKIFHRHLGPNLLIFAVKVSLWFHRHFTVILWHITDISPRKNTDQCDFLLKRAVRAVASTFKFYDYMEITGVALAPKILEPKKSPILIFSRQFSNIEAKLWFHFLSSRFLSHFCKYTS